MEKPGSKAQQYSARMIYKAGLEARGLVSMKLVRLIHGGFHANSASQKVLALRALALVCPTEPAGKQRGRGRSKLRMLEVAA